MGQGLFCDFEMQTRIVACVGMASKSYYVFGWLELGCYFLLDGSMFR